MGAKHSKPRIRRSQRFSSTRKRQAPEGSNDPPTIVNETWKHEGNKLNPCFNDNTHNTEEKCRFCTVSGKQYDPSDQKDQFHKVSDDLIKSRCGFPSNFADKSSFINEFMNQANLKVNLPNSPDRCRSYNTNVDKCRSLPPKISSSFQESTNQMGKDDEDEWTITLYEIDKMSGRVPREDMVRLMSSIYDAVDNRVGESPQGRKTVRVRLSVTPERQNHSKLHRTSSNPQKNKTECRCQDCPKTEPSSRRVSDDRRIRRHRSDVSSTHLRTGSSQVNQHHEKMQEISKHKEKPFQQFQKHSGEHTEREKLHSKGRNQLFINENPHLCESNKGVISINKDSRGIKHRTLPKIDQTHQEKPSSKSRERRPRYHGNDSRNAMLKNRRKDPRFASPYDQHFQEAMYLRLKELQRQGAHEMCRATGRLRDSDEADDDSSSELENENIKSNIESNDKLPICNTDETHTNCKNDVLQNEKDISENNDSQISNIYHHHHYHHGISGESVLAAICSSDSSPVPKTITDSSSISQLKGNNEQHFHHYHHHYHHAEKS